MNEDFPWFLLAMVIIAFLRWIVLKIQGESPTEDFDETLFADEEEAEEGERLVYPRADPTVAPNEEIQEFFEQLRGRRGAAEEAKPPPAPVSAPPPLPPAGVELPSKTPPAEVPRPPSATAYDIAPPRPRLSPEEAAALLRIKESGRKRPQQRRARTPSGPITLRKLVGSNEGLRTAVLLREILGKPKGLKSLEEFRSF